MSTSRFERLADRRGIGGAFAAVTPKRAAIAVEIRRSRQSERPAAVGQRRRAAASSACAHACELRLPLRLSRVEHLATSGRSVPAPLQRASRLTAMSGPLIRIVAEFVADLAGFDIVCDQRRDAVSSKWRQCGQVERAIFDELHLRLRDCPSETRRPASPRRRSVQSCCCSALWRRLAAAGRAGSSASRRAAAGLRRALHYFSAASSCGWSFSQLAVSLSILPLMTNDGVPLKSGILGVDVARHLDLLVDHLLVAEALVALRLRHAARRGPVLQPGELAELDEHLVGRQVLDLLELVLRRRAWTLPIQIGWSL